MVIPGLVATAIGGAANITSEWTAEFAPEEFIARGGLEARGRHLTDHRPHSATLMKGEIR